MPLDCQLMGSVPRIFGLARCMVLVLKDYLSNFVKRCYYVASCYPSFCYLGHLG